MNDYDDITPKDAPPTYQEAILLPPTPANRPTSRPPAPYPPRPYPQTQSVRPSSSSNPPLPERPNAENLYTNNPNLPWKYPKGVFCQYCKNTGFNAKKNGKICKDCWKRFYANKHAYNPNPNLTFKYPKGYICTKCNNTGIKLKNGLSCKDCYEFFSPRNLATYSNSYSAPNFNIMQRPFAPTMVTTQMAPLKVLPGDPRIGGVLCGRCRGSGVVLVLFFDDELCPVCNGVGRIINSFPHLAPPPQTRPFGYNGPLR